MDTPALKPSHLTLIFALIIGGCLPIASLAAGTTAPPGTCVVPPATGLTPGKPLSGKLPTDDKVLITADIAESIGSHTTTFRGNVRIYYQGRAVRADEVRYHRPSKQLKLSGNIAIESEDGNVFQSDSAELDTELQRGKLNVGEFYFSSNQGRGSARNILFNEDRTITLESAKFTTCPSNNESWALFFRKLTLDQASDNGTGYHAVLRVGGIPVFYTPYLRFPLGNRRQSGLLAPEFGSGDNTGSIVGIPYYLNLAPNYDATVTARHMSRRGTRFDTEFRYLGKQYSGMLTGEYLANDAITGTQRNFLSAHHQQQFSENLSASIVAESASDSNYFDDLVAGDLQNSPDFLRRQLDISYQPDTWLIGARVVGYQLLDTTLPAGEFPYRRLPEIHVHRWPIVVANKAVVKLDANIGDYQHETLESAKRTNINPVLELPFRRPWGYLVPALNGYYTSYTDRSAGSDTSFVTGIATIDSGLVFERTGKTGNRQTLEPRIYYAYSPYVDQSTLPVIDTVEADPRYDRLFRANRFIGGDRVGDEDRVSLGLSSRWYDRQHRQRLQLGIGQSYYFSDRLVSATLPASPAQTAARSETLLEITANFSEMLYGRATWTMSPTSERVDFSRQFLQYQPTRNRIVGLGYRYQRGGDETVDSSAQWQLGRNWSVFGRLQYSLSGNSHLNSYAGFRYRSCCWSLETVASRRVDTNGQPVRAVQFQLTLSGLSSGDNDRHRNRPLGQSVFFDQ